jgi:hypothetical protein
MRLIVMAALALVAVFAGTGAAAAQDDPVCAAKAQQWETLRDLRDVNALVRFRSTIPSACADLAREVDRALDALSGAAGASQSPPSGYDKPSASAPGSASSSFPSDVFDGSSGLSAAAASEERGQAQAERAERERRRQMEAERAAAQLAQQQAAAAKADRADRAEAKAARPSAPPREATAGSGPSPPPPPPVALPAGYEIVSHVLTPTESYLPKRDGMPTGVVLLDSREKTKNQSLCKALLGANTATVKTEAAARRDNSNGDFLVTHWPVTGVVADQGDCVELLAKYDFERATRVKNAYALTGSRGPVFLALDPTGEIVFLDLKDASADTVFKATSDWMKLALASPQNRPAAEPRVGLVAGTNRLFAELAVGLSSLVGGNSGGPTVVKFNDPVKGTSRQFNIYKAGVYLIGATFTL